MVWLCMPRSSFLSFLLGFVSGTRLTATLSIHIGLRKLEQDITGAVEEQEEDEIGMREAADKARLGRGRTEREPQGMGAAKRMGGGKKHVGRRRGSGGAPLGRAEVRSLGFRGTSSSLTGLGKY